MIHVVPVDDYENTRRMARCTNSGGSMIDIGELEAVMRQHKPLCPYGIKASLFLPDLIAELRAYRLAEMVEKVPQGDF